MTETLKSIKRRKVFTNLDEAKKYATFTNDYWNIIVIESATENTSLIVSHYQDYFWIQKTKNILQNQVVLDWVVDNRAGNSKVHTIPEIINYDQNNNIISIVPTQTILLDQKWQQVEKTIEVEVPENYQQLPQILYIVVDTIQTINQTWHDSEELWNNINLPKPENITMEDWIVKAKTKTPVRNSKIVPEFGLVKLARINSSDNFTQTETTFKMEILAMQGDLLQIKNITTI
jgi:hypothetical protein